MPNPRLLTAQSSRVPIQEKHFERDGSRPRCYGNQIKQEAQAKQKLTRPESDLLSALARQQAEGHKPSPQPVRSSPASSPGRALDRVVRRCAWWRRWWWWWWWSAVCFFKWCRAALRAPMGGPGRVQPKKRRPRRSSEPYMPFPHSGLSKSRGRVPI